MPAGSAPGERRGGRQKGAPNKSTWARADKAQAQARKRGQPLGVEMLETAMMQAAKMMARYQIGGEEPNEPLFGKYLGLLISASGKISPYQSPTLQSTVLQGDKEHPLEATLNIRFV